MTKNNEELHTLFIAQEDYDNLCEKGKINSLGIGTDIQGHATCRVVAMPDTPVERVLKMREVGIACQCCNKHRILRKELVNDENKGMYVCGPCYLEARRLRAEHDIRKRIDLKEQPKNRAQRKHLDKHVKRMVKKLLRNAPLDWVAE